VNLISIIERLETKHALKAEREMKNFHALSNGAAILGGPDRNGILQKDIYIFENEQVRVSTTSVPQRYWLVDAARWARSDCSLAGQNKSGGGNKRKRFVFPFRLASDLDSDKQRRQRA